MLLSSQSPQHGLEGCQDSTPTSSSAAAQGCTASSAAAPAASLLAPVLVTAAGDVTSSEEPEGGSPMSDRSVGVQLCGTHASRITPPRKNRGLTWVLRQLQRKQRQQPSSDPQLVSGSSYESLCSLDEQLQWQEREQCPMLQHPQQQQQPTLPPTALAPPSSASNAAAEASSSSNSTEPEGLLRRAVKAVLRPVVRAVVGAARTVASCAGPQGPGNNDNSMAERVINVLTSLPFFAVGLHGLRNRRCPKGRHFALSFLALGAVASGYHGADRSSWMRPIMRKLDYYTICYTSNVLRRAAHIRLPSAAQAAAVLVAPFKPTLVTGLNLALVEGKFMRHALAHTHLRRSFKAHLGSAAVGMACFGLEDVATGAGWPPVLHSLWHCLSAAAMGCLHGLLHHLELAVLVEGLQMEAAAGGN